MHVFGPPGLFPFSRERRYTPAEASLEELRAHLDALGLERVVIVQPSPYGTDNSCTLDALRRLGPMARGVAVIDGSTSEEELRDMKAAGIRGVRVNLETEGERDPAVARRRLEEAARRVAPLGWHVQVFTNKYLLKQIEPLAAPLVIDHFGLAESPDDLLALMGKGEVWVKLSAPHRLAVDPGPLVRALVAEVPERLLWGSDWPHVPRQRRSPERADPFEAVDDAAALARLRGWAPANVVHKILVENPARLYDF